MCADTIPGRFIARAEERPDAPGYYVRTSSGWKATSWADYLDETQRAARALIALGLEPGDKVCILGFNRPEWTIFDLAAMMSGGVPAGIYTTCSAPEVQYIVDHSEAAIVLLEDEAQWAKIDEERDNLPRLQHVVTMRGARVDDPLVMGWEAFLSRADAVEQATLDERLENLEDDDVATLIYTSGTTGPPKAVMLTHKNLAWTASVAVELTSADHRDSSLSYLPLSHIAEQIFTIHAPMCTGHPIYFAESIEKVADNIKEVQPRVVFGVPRIWEKFHAGVTAKLAETTGLKKRLINWAMSVGNDVADVKNRGREPGFLLGLKHKLATALIFSKLKPALGLGEARVCISGAAPIAKEVLEFFTGLDIIIHEVYGQSEDTGPTSFNAPGRTRLGSVGPPLPGVKVKIGEDDEILVKGPNVFKGYYKDPAATAETLVDGWLHSGDLGRFDDEGFLHITGRKKEIIITAGGKNIAPKNIESALKNLELVSQAVVIGDRRKFLSALITLDPAASEKWAADKGLDPNNGVHQHPDLIEEIQRGVDGVNKLFARVEHIRKFTVLERDFTVEDGELTPTLKIKRRVVNEHFAEQIEAMYADA